MIKNQFLLFEFLHKSKVINSVESEIKAEKSENKSEKKTDYKAE